MIKCMDIQNRNWSVSRPPYFRKLRVDSVSAIFAVMTHDFVNFFLLKIKKNPNPKYNEPMVPISDGATCTHLTTLLLL